MGERYFGKCKKCGNELYFGNWSNYTNECLKCHTYYIIVHDIREISKEDYEKIKNTDDTFDYNKLGSD